ncbi:sugar kinase [Frigidibacter sp. MR17.24]|uniref:sugar kinase n=1 Tax=Frigidibacter sp. MR17.24 TaxID=3127345 RepID=UPI003012F87A
MMRFVSVGECMLELTGTGAPNTWKSGFAGDTFNTAWYARRALPTEWSVAYHTVVGTDPLSDGMVQFIADAGVETATIGRHPTRMPGLYMVTLTNGERSFTYWRETAAARTLADDPVVLDAALDGATLVYFSGITAAILGDKRSDFLRAVGRARAAGATVAFDPNIRPRLWSSPDALRAGLTEAAAAADIVLPGYEDEAHWFGDADPTVTAQRYLAGGSSEVMVKNGGGEVALGTAEGIESFTLGPAVKPLDTTGAGDSFNGAYLSARLQGASPRVAAAAGDALARRVIMQRGALVEDH